MCHRKEVDDDDFSEMKLHTDNHAFLICRGGKLAIRMNDLICNNFSNIVREN